MSPVQIQLFQFAEDQNHFENLTTFNIDGEIWFLAKDVWKLLDIKNVSDALSRLDNDEKSSIVISDRTSWNPNKSIINESWLYALVFRSTKPSAKLFRKWVTKEVIPSIRKTGAYWINRLETPNFVVRFNDNWDRTERWYFSVIWELFIRLYGQFERVWYQIPNKALNDKEIRPDVSVWRLFSDYLKKNHPEFSNKYKMYSHRFPNGTEYDCRQYQNEVLPTFIYFVDNIWIPEKWPWYFKDRDPLALEYIPKLLPPWKKLLKEKSLSDFNKKLKKWLEYNPKD